MIDDIKEVSKKQSCILDFAELEERFDIPIKPNNVIGSMLISELENRNAIDELQLYDDSIEIVYNSTNTTQKDKEKGIYLTLKALMSCNLEDIHLVSTDEENDLATIVELNNSTLTEQGKQDWGDVLDATVERIYSGLYGLQIEVSGCEAERLKEFSLMLAGQCSITDYNKWVNTQENEMKNETEMECN